MKFETFKKNVERWASERGIYEHSTPKAQLLKAMMITAWVSIFGRVTILTNAQLSTPKMTNGCRFLS